MSKNKLLVALMTGVLGMGFTAGAFAQDKPQDDAMSAPTHTTGSSDTKATKHKSHKHTHSASKKTPAAETGNNAAAEGGQSK